MSHQKDISVVGDEGAALAGAIAPSSRSGTRRREPVIAVFSQRPAAHSAGDESDLDEGVSSLGSLSVRLLAQWSKPRMMLGPSWEGDDPSSR